MRLSIGISLLATTLACSSGGSDDGGAGGSGAVCAVDYGAVDASGSLVSFESDVAPVLQANCAIATCHRRGSNAGGLGLGPTPFEESPLTPPSLDEIHATLLGAATGTPDIPYVTAGDPQRSFLMLKIDGCQDSFGLDCSVLGGDCGNQMPRNSPPLEPEESEPIRIWIAQGASRN